MFNTVTFKSILFLTSSLAFFGILAAQDTTIELETITKKQLEELGEGSPDSIQLVNFWATWCGPCREEFPELVKINQRFPDLELITVSVDQANQREQAIAFLKEYPMTGRSFIFEGDDPFAGLESFDPEWKEMVPHTVVLHPDKGVIFRSEGVFDTDELIGSIARELDEKGSE